MIRTLTPLLLAALLAGTVPAAHAEPATPLVCGSPGVLEVVATRLHRAGLESVIEAGSVGQAPGPEAGTVECAVRVHTLVYDTARRGLAPVDRVSIYRYRLDLRRNAIFVGDP